MTAQAQTVSSLQQGNQTISDLSSEWCLPPTLSLHTPGPRLMWNNLILVELPVFRPAQQRTSSETWKEKGGEASPVVYFVQVLLCHFGSLSLCSWTRVSLCEKLCQRVSTPGGSSALRSCSLLHAHGTKERIGKVRKSERTHGIR